MLLFFSKNSFSQTTIAHTGTATQVSTYGSYIADLAIDGNTSCDIADNSFTRTVSGNAWWDTLKLKHI